MTTHLRRYKQTIVVVSTLAIWQVVSLDVGEQSRVPSPVAILTSIIAARHEYVPHILSTVFSASEGLLWGLLAACFLAALIQLFPILELFYVPSTLLFSIPLIVLVPIIGMTLDPNLTPAVCAALLVYYPVLVLINAGLQNVPRELFSYATSTGTGRLSILLKLRARFALPGFAAGLQVAIPAALLGSMLGEFTGVRWGLGAYLLAIMAQANPAKEWALFFTIATLASVSTWISSQVWKRLGVSVAPISLVTARTRLPNGSLIVGVLLSILLWEGASVWMANPFFVKGPVELWRYTVRYISANGSSVFSALAVTLQWVAIGLIVGLAAGFVFAITIHLLPLLRGPLLGVAFITQAVPIVALIPLCIALFGRGPAATMAITISATFFLCFSAVYQGLEATPDALINFGISAGASHLSILWHFRIPAAIPFLFAAARVTTPRVFLGVTLAEYLATRQGLGALLFEARGTLDFGLMWLIACCAGAVSMLFAGGIAYLEQRALSRYL